MILFLVYFFLYCGASFFGEYKHSISGFNRDPVCYLGYVDSLLWQPYGTYLRFHRNVGGNMDVEMNVLGGLYMPLLILDRLWVHKNQYIMPEETRPINWPII